MATRKPVVLINGQLQELPSGDIVAGAPGVSSWKEPVSVYNAGAPETIYDSTGDTVMTDAS